MFGMERRFIALLVGIYLFVKGTADSILVLAALPLYQQKYHLSSDHFQKLYSIVLVPWSMKCLFACGIDSVRGKALVLAAASALGAVACGVLASIPPVETVIWMYLCASTAAMMVDSTAEGKYSQEVKLNNGSNSVTPFVWGLVSIGSIAAACVVGPFADSGLFEGIYAAAAVCFGQLLVPTLLIKGSVPPDRAKTSPSRAEWQTAVAVSGSGLFCGLMVATAPPYLATLGSLYCVAIASYVITCWYGNSELTRGMLFVFLFELFNIQIPGPTDFWWTSPCPGLPNLDYTTYVTISAVVGGVSSLAVCAVYMLWIQDMPLATQFVVAGGSRLLPALTELVISRRFNLDVGISDKTAFLVAGSALGPAAVTLTIMPIAQLATKLAAPGLETVSFSMVAASANLGKAISLMVGLMITNWFEVDSTGCQFDNYPALLFFCNILIPLGGVVLSRSMIY